MATVWATFRGVASASGSIERGEGDLLQEAVRIRLAAIDWPPIAADLDGIIDELAPEGLRYLALLDGAGNITVDAGAPATSRGQLATEVAGARPDVPRDVGGVLRLVDRRPQANRPRRL